jgi:glycosyltransferase involved in cell wall biosynthesis
MKVKVWNASERYSGFTTGVGKHVINMVSGLAQRPGVDIEFVVPRDSWARDQALQPGALLAAIPSKPHPLSRRTSELLWLACGHPKIDETETDWVYAPRERYAPTRQAKTIVTVHDVYGFEPEYRALRSHKAPPLAEAVLRRALTHADIVAAVSNFTANRLCDLFGTEPNKVIVIGNGVEEHFFGKADVAVKDFAPQLNGDYILSVGGLTHKKGARYLLELARALKVAAPNVVLAITGPVESAYQAEASTLKNVLLLGRGYSNEQMHALVAEAAVMVALSEYEGFGIPLLEAMAAGSPVVAARRAALPEVVADAGLVVEPSDTAAVCDAVLGVINDQALRRGLILLGHSRARSFRWSACVDRLFQAMTNSASGLTDSQSDGRAA